MKQLRHLTSILMILLIVALSAGTVIEKLHDSDYAASHIYSAWWFIALWAAFAAIGAVLTFRNKNWKRPMVLTLFLSVACILLGALLTMITGQHGKMMLQPNVANKQFTVEKHGNTKECALPFSLTLERFEVETYPGTRSPMDFVSYLHIDDNDGEATKEAKISMNNILKHRNYRFYQSDYDDEGNSVLSVAHDPWGIAVTYIGYILLLLAIILAFTAKNGEFRTLIRKASGKVAVLLVLFTFGSSIMISAADEPTEIRRFHASTSLSGRSPRTLPKESADKMGQMYVMYKGRVCPLQTLAKDFTTKLCGNARYKGLSPEQVFSGWIFYFDDWKNEPMMKIKGGFVQQQLGIKGKYASMTDFVTPTGQNKLADTIKALPMGDPKRKKFSTADEKYQLITMLNNGKLLKLFPHADSTQAITWYSQNDKLPLDIPEDEYLFIRKQLSLCQEYVVKNDFKNLNEVFEKTKRYQEMNALGTIPSKTRYGAERLYNRLSAGKWLAMACITLGLVCFALSLVGFGKKKSLFRPLRIIGMIWMIGLCVFLALLFILRWIAGGHAPMAGSFDSMNLMALAICIITLCTARKYEMALPTGLLTSGFVLLVQMIGGANPPVTHLMPVLSSPLLSLHVTVIMMAYALLFFVMLNGLSAVVVRLMQPTNTGYLERLQDISRIMLYPAVALLAAGIFIGAVWANISWGNYWSWDPKEVWALITLLVYALPLFHNVMTSFRKPMFFHIYSILAFLSVIITYFGVNLILGGIHAYN